LFCASTFEAFFVARLDEARSYRPDVVPLVRRAFEFHIETADPGTRPTWLAPENAPVASLEDARALELRGSLAAAERAYLSAYLHTQPNDEARAALMRIYAALGWSLAIENLHSQEDA
jgi:hypothetical protein